jgi:hypothetical protein
MTATFVPLTGGFMRSLVLAAVLGAAALIVVGSAMPAPSSATTKAWRITIENLTDDASSTVGQPLSPPLVGVHTAAADLWTVGESASEIIRYIAEDGDPFYGQPLFAATTGVRSSTILLAPGLPPEQQPIFPGQSRSAIVTTTQNANRLSIAMMLGATNDAFTGLDALHLNGRGGVYYVNAYDAGTERNNEDAAYMGALGGLASLYVRDPEHGVIAPHPRIRGDNDLDPAVWGWDDPVARITIERL